MKRFLSLCIVLVLSTSAIAVPVQPPWKAAVVTAATGLATTSIGALAGLLLGMRVFVPGGHSRWPGGPGADIGTIAFIAIGGAIGAGLAFKLR